jgi:hypothetical protein
MLHAEMQEIVQRFFEAGGTVKHIEEGAVTVDWVVQAPMFKAARHMSKLGHKRRRRKTGKVVRVTPP